MQRPGQTDKRYKNVYLLKSDWSNRMVVDLRRHQNVFPTSCSTIFSSSFEFMGYFCTNTIKGWVWNTVKRKQTDWRWCFLSCAFMTLKIYHTCVTMLFHLTLFYCITASFSLRLAWIWTVTEGFDAWKWCESSAKTFTVTSLTPTGDFGRTCETNAVKQWGNISSVESRHLEIWSCSYSC